MKKIFSFLIILCFVCVHNAVFASNIKVYAEKADSYPMKTVTKNFTPYILTFVNNDNETLYFSANSDIKFVTEDNEVKNILSDEKFYKKVRKREIGRYCWITLPASLVGGFVIGASFLLLTLPGIGIVVAGNVPFLSAIKYNSRIAQDFYIDNSLPLNLDKGNVKNTYVFLPKKENVKTIIITNLSTEKSKPFDLEIPVL